VVRPLCPGCFSSSVVPVPHGAEPRSSDWLETVDGFGALWDAFDNWQCLVCGERWPHIESVVARTLGTGRPSNDLAREALSSIATRCRLIGLTTQETGAMDRSACRGDLAGEDREPLGPGCHA
jgi:hypothetical protein